MSSARRAGVAAGADVQLELLLAPEPGQQCERHDRAGAVVEMRPAPDAAPGGLGDAALEVAVEIGDGRRWSARHARHPAPVAACACRPRMGPADRKRSRAAAIAAGCSAVGICAASGDHFEPRAGDHRRAAPRRWRAGVAWSASPTRPGWARRAAGLCVVRSAAAIASAEAAYPSGEVASSSSRSGAETCAGASGVTQRDEDRLDHRLPFPSPAPAPPARARGLAGGIFSAVSISTSEITRSGAWCASSCATRPPIERPTTCARSIPSASQDAQRVARRAGRWCKAPA